MDKALEQPTQSPPKRRSLVGRVVASFVVVVVAFLATVIASQLAQRRAASDVEALSRGYLPLETALARARSAQWTLAARLDRLLDDPRAAGMTREWIETVARSRPSVLSEAREAATNLSHASDDATRDLGPRTRSTLEEIERGMAESSRSMPAVFGALDARDTSRSETLLRALSARERDSAERLDRLANEVGRLRAAVVVATVARDRQAAFVSASLVLLSLVVAALGARSVRQRLRPLEDLTERARAIAAIGAVPTHIDAARDADGRDAGATLQTEAEALRKAPKGGGDDEIEGLRVAFGAMVDAVARRDEDVRRLRKRQEDIFNHLRAAVVAVTSTGRVEAANPAAAKLLGVKTGDQLEDAAPKLAESLREDITYAIEHGGEPAPHMAVQLGQVPAMDLRVVPMQDAGKSRDDVGRDDVGRLALLVADDVSEAVAAGARALQAERLAAIGKMAAHVTHEIRNPLSSMGLNVELLDESLATVGNVKSTREESKQSLAEARRLLTAIAREVARLADVSEEYLRVARLPRPKATPVDVGELVRDVLRFAGPELDRAQVQVRTDIPGTRVMALADEAQLRQALHNLVRNAREAMEDGGELFISVQQTLAVGADSSRVTLEVADNGAGIPDELRGRIFDPFFTTKATGTGLGLPLTRQILEAHGGDIQCLPASPRGTRFVLDLPAAERKST